MEELAPSEVVRGVWCWRRELQDETQDAVCVAGTVMATLGRERKVHNELEVKL